MPLEYSSKIGLEAVIPIIDEYVVWHGKLVLAYLEEKPMEMDPPRAFNDWIAHAVLPDDTALRANRIHDGMMQAAVIFSQKYTARTQAPWKEYRELSRHYEEFIEFMHRLEVELAIENSGFDQTTGLRSSKLMYEDLSRELERRARRGNPFSIALIKINHFKEEWRDQPNSIEAMVRNLSNRVKECLRSFDDAYYLGGEYFLLSLKHAETHGAQAALKRLNIIMRDKPVFEEEGPSVEVTVSSVIHEPAPGDSFVDLLEHMKKDLDGINDKGTVLQYNDMSPLQRYLHSTEKAK